MRLRSLSFTVMERFFTASKAVSQALSMEQNASRV